MGKTGGEDVWRMAVDIKDVHIKRVHSSSILIIRREKLTKKLTDRGCHGGVSLRCEWAQQTCVEE